MPDQVHSEDGQTYRFISDPKYKENLSGRVRAACITCRRKKIKCSGEVPCTTCREKGVVCEGLTKRKRPSAKSDAQLSSDVSPDVGRSSSVTSPEIPEAEFLQRKSHAGLSIRIGMPPNAPQRPALKTTDTVSSDSGYSSGNQSNRHESISGFKLPFESFNSTLEAYDGSNNISPTNTGFQDWTSALQGHTSSYIESDGSNRTQSLPAVSPTDTIDMTDSSSWNTYWWLDNTSNPVTSGNLLSTARVLEEQAQSLRILASRQNSSLVDNHGGQTATLPASSDTNDTFNNVSLQPEDRFMASLFTDGSLRKRSNTIGRDFSPYSDLNSNYSTAYGDQELPHSQYQALHLAGLHILDPATPDLHQNQNIGADAGSRHRRSQEHGTSDLSQLRHHQANESEQFGFTAFFGPLDRHP